MGHPAHDDLGRAQQAIAEAIAGLDLIDDHALRRGLRHRNDRERVVDRIAGSSSRMPHGKNAPVSAQSPQNYLIHTVVIAIILAVCLVLFLRHAWG